MTPTVPEAARAPAAAPLSPALRRPVGQPVRLPADPAPATRWRRPLPSSSTPPPAISARLGPGVGPDPDPGPGALDRGLHADDRGPRPMNLPATANSLGRCRPLPRPTAPLVARPCGLPADPAPETGWRGPLPSSAAPDPPVSARLGPGVGSDPGPGSLDPGHHTDDRGPRPMNRPAAADAASPLG